jgi:hypothetical protein
MRTMTHITWGLVAVKNGVSVPGMKDVVGRKMSLYLSGAICTENIENGFGQEIHLGWSILKLPM